MAMILDPRSLKLFVAVVEEGTITAAAKREHIATSAVSRRLSDLETQLGTPLLQRTNQGIEPSLAGIALLGMARHLLNEHSAVAAQMAMFSTGLRGVVRIAANLSSITQYLPADIKMFLAEHSNIQIVLEEKTSAAVARAVWENAADIGLFSNIPVEHPVEIVPYREDRLCIVVPQKHPLHKLQVFQFSDALKYDFVGLQNGSSINHMASSAAFSLKQTLRMKIQVTGFDSLCMMVSEGLGIGVMPLALAKKYRQIFDIEIIQIHERWAERSLSLCVRQMDSLSKPARLLVEYLCKKVNDN